MAQVGQGRVTQQPDCRRVGRPRGHRKRPSVSPGPMAGRPRHTWHAKTEAGSGRVRQSRSAGRSSTEPSTDLHLCQRLHRV